MMKKSTARKKSETTPERKPDRWAYVSKFLAECRALSGAGLRDHIARSYREALGETMLPSMSFVRAKAIIGRALQIRGFEEAGCAKHLNPVVRQRMVALLRGENVAYVDIAERQEARELAAQAETTSKRSARAKQQFHAPKRAGRTLGLSPGQTWWRVFQDNEERIGRGEKPLTDEEISGFMKKEFPEGAKKQCEPGGVHAVRGLINRSKMKGGKDVVFSGPLYLRYGENGQPIAKGTHIAAARVRKPIKVKVLRRKKA